MFACEDIYKMFKKQSQMHSWMFLAAFCHHQIIVVVEGLDLIIFYAAYYVAWYQGAIGLATSHGAIDSLFGAYLWARYTIRMQSFGGQLMQNGVAGY